MIYDVQNVRVRKLCTSYTYPTALKEEQKHTHNVNASAPALYPTIKARSLSQPTAFQDRSLHYTFRHSH